MLPMGQTPFTAPPLEHHEVVVKVHGGVAMAGGNANNIPERHFCTCSHLLGRRAHRIAFTYRAPAMPTNSGRPESTLKAFRPASTTARWVVGWLMTVAAQTTTAQRPAWGCPRADCDGSRHP